MLSCLCDNQYIEASKELSRKLNFICPECKEALILRAGSKNIPHFAHKVKSNCTCGAEETTWHRKGKICIGNFAKQKGYNVKYEVKLGNRRTDVLLEKDNLLIAVELQRRDEGSTIYKRTNDLLKYCNKVIWVLEWNGKKEFDDEDLYKTTATYSINALYSKKNKPKAEIRFFDEKNNSIYKCQKEKYYIYKEAYEDFSGDVHGDYTYVSKRWCYLKILKKYQIDF